MRRMPLSAAGAAAVLLGVAACGDPAETAEQSRDLTLAPVYHSLATLDDGPALTRGPAGSSTLERAEPRREMPAQPSEPDAEPPAEPDLEPESREAPAEPAGVSEPPAPPTLGEGYPLNLSLLDDIEPRENAVGTPVSARIEAPVFSENGDLVIPAGAVFRGTVSEVVPEEGRVELAFTVMEFSDAEHSIETVTATVSAGGESVDSGREPVRGSGVGTAIADTRGEGIGGVPGGPTIVISAGTGIGCTAPRGFFPGRRGIFFRR